MCDFHLGHLIRGLGDLCRSMCRLHCFFFEKNYTYKLEASIDLYEYMGIMPISEM